MEVGQGPNWGCSAKEKIKWQFVVGRVGSLLLAAATWQRQVTTEQQTEDFVVIYRVCKLVRLLESYVITTYNHL
jgi:hypothetical protein